MIILTLFDHFFLRVREEAMTSIVELACLFSTARSSYLEDNNMWVTYIAIFYILFNNSIIKKVSFSSA